MLRLQLLSHTPDSGVYYDAQISTGIGRNHEENLVCRHYSVASRKRPGFCKEMKNFSRGTGDCSSLIYPQRLALSATRFAFRLASHNVS